jgi:hypothetical protein
MRQIRNAYKILAGKPERKKSLMRPRHRWEDNIKIYLRETLWEGVDWILLTQDVSKWRELLNTVINLCFP